MSWLLLAIMFAGPFITIHGNPLLMINVVERKFSVLGVIFWPQDNLVFALGLLLFLMGIAVCTAAFGRLWCGWTCPQTVLMEMVFRRIEYFIEGDSHQQRALAKAPWSAGKCFKKGIKHAIFFSLSFLIGNTLLAYIIGLDALKEIVTDDPRQHLTGLSFMLLFTLVFYGILIDSIGLGAGVLDRCMELGLPVRGVNVGESPAVNDGKYSKLRDELWWRCREWFAGRDVSIPEDARLVGELTSVQYGFQSNGKLKVEDKDSLRKRGLKSPDVADALVLTFAGGLDRPAREKKYEKYSKYRSGERSWMSL